MSTDAPDAPAEPDAVSVGVGVASSPAAPSKARPAWVPYAVILTIGLLFATGFAIGADRQPVVWMMPPLVLTTVALGVFALADRRREDRSVQAAAAGSGLTDIGIQTLPPLTPFLAHAAPPRVFAGELGDGIPCRVARVRGLVLCICEAPGGLGAAIAERPPKVLDHDLLPPEIPESHPLVADPAGLLGAPMTADVATVEWAAEHDVALAADDGTLVVAARGGSFDSIRTAALAARTRLA